MFEDHAVLLTERFIRAYNADLADQLGNLLSRFAGMVDRYAGGVVPAPGAIEAIDCQLINIAQALPQRVDTALANFTPHEALIAIWDLIGAANKYVVDVRPWELAKQRRETPAIEQRLSTALYNLAEIALLKGNFEQAETLHEESLALKRGQQDAWSIAWSLTSLAKLALYRGDARRAVHLYQESLMARRQLGDKAGLAESLAGLAGVIFPEQPLVAARLLGAVDRVRSEINYASPVSGNYQQMAANLHSHPNETALKSAWMEGQEMSLEQIINEALALDF